MPHGQWVSSHHYCQRGFSMETIKNVIKKAVSAVGQPPVGQQITTNDSKTAQEALAALSKEARKALKETGQWHQDFHGNELVSVVAMFLATRKAVIQKEQALTKAIEFIGLLENDDFFGETAVSTLESINQILVGETIGESMAKH